MAQTSYTGTITGNDNITYSLSNNTITVTPKNGYILKSLTANISSYAGGPTTLIKGTVTNNVGTIVIPNDFLNNSSATLTLYPQFVYVTALPNATINFDGTNNTWTVSCNPGYHINELHVDGNSLGYLTKDIAKPTISADKKTATFTITNPLTYNRISLRGDIAQDTVQLGTSGGTNVGTSGGTNVGNVAEPAKPVTNTVKYTGADVAALPNTTINFDGTNTWTVSSNPGYYINELHVDGRDSQGYIIKDIAKPTISADKKTATFTITNPTYHRIVLRGDIAQDTVQIGTSNGTDNVRIYEVDDDTLKTLSTQSFSYFSNGNNVSYNFQQFVNQLYKLPFSIPTSLLTPTSQVITGMFALNAKAYKINQQKYTLDLGKITVPVTNGFDYNIKNIKLLLPWVQAIKLNASEILGKTLHIVYNVNLLDGLTTIVISSDDVVVNSVQVDISTKIEMFNIYSNKLNGSLTSTLQNDLRQAYIKVNYYKPVENLISYPTNEHGTLKNYTGYTKVKNVKLSKSTNSIVDSMIISELKEGIFIK